MPSNLLHVKQEQLEELLHIVGEVIAKQNEVDALIKSLVDRVTTLDIVETHSTPLETLLGSKPSEDTKESPVGDPSAENEVLDNTEEPETGWRMLIMDSGGVMFRVNSIADLEQAEYNLDTCSVQIMGVSDVAQELFHNTTRKDPVKFPPVEFVEMLELYSEDKLQEFLTLCLAGCESFQNLVNRQEARDFPVNNVVTEARHQDTSWTLDVKTKNKTRTTISSLRALKREDFDPTTSKFSLKHSNPAVGTLFARTAGHDPVRFSPVEFFETIEGLTEDEIEQALTAAQASRALTSYADLLAEVEIAN